MVRTFFFFFGFLFLDGGGVFAAENRLFVDCIGDYLTLLLELVSLGGEHFLLHLLQVSVFLPLLYLPYR